jgi:hypothetical protein
MPISSIFTRLVWTPVLIPLLLWMSVDLSIAPSSAISPITVPPNALAAQPRCGNLLAALGTPLPAQLTFVDCQAPVNTQLKTLVAKYRVTGQAAASIEQWLQRHFKMAALQFICCGWSPVRRMPRGNESGAAWVRGAQGLEHKITMYSDETGRTRRQDWSQIPFFYVEVTQYLESP